MNLLSAINKIAFTIGNLEVAWYGIIIVIGMIAGLAIICFECKRVNLNVDDAVELFLWVIPLAVVFCRVFYVARAPTSISPSRAGAISWISSRYGTAASPSSADLSEVSSAQAYSRTVCARSAISETW